MTPKPLDTAAIRKQFPSLLRKHNDMPMIFTDGPAGTQVPQSVIDAISHYYKNSNANSHRHDSGQNNHQNIQYLVGRK